MRNSKQALMVRDEMLARLDGIRAPASFGDRRLLDVAIERDDDELAALCLLVAAAEAMNELPRDAIEAFLDEFAPETAPSHRGSRAQSRRDPHERKR